MTTNAGADRAPRVVVVVEDDTDLRELYAACLEGNGWSVARAVNGLDALVQLAASDGGGSVLELADGAGDPPGHDGGDHATQHQCAEGQQSELQPGSPDGLVHAPLGEPDPDRSPLLAVDLDRQREVVERFLRVRRHGLLDQQRFRPGRPLVHVARQRDADPLGATAVRGHLAVGVEHDRVDDVVLAGHPGRILLEHGEVVEQQRPQRDRGQVPGQDLAAPVELADDGVPLALLDDDRDGGHEQAEEEYRAPQ